MKHHIVKISVFVIGIVAIGWIAIAQAQRQADEVTVLPPPSANRAPQNVATTPILEARQNPYRGGRESVSSARRGLRESQQSPLRSAPAADPFLANSIPAASDPRQPVPAYGVEPTERRLGERNPIRMTAYGGAPAEVEAAPSLNSPQDPAEATAPGQYSGYSAPTMAPPQPSLAEDVARDSFPSAPAGDFVDDRVQESNYEYGQPTGPARSPAALNERPLDPSPAAPIESRESYSPQQEDPQRHAPVVDNRTYSNASGPEPTPVLSGRMDPPTPSYPERAPIEERAPVENAPMERGPAAYDSGYRSAPASNVYGSPASANIAEPDRLPADQGERIAAPVANYNAPDTNYSSPTPSYGSSDPGYREDSRNETPVDRSYQDRTYASDRAPQSTPPARDRYPAIEPVGSESIESTGPTGVGRPARDESWDGEQLPQLRVVKVAPKEIQVGKPAVFRVEIQNVGRVAAQGVEVRDQIPQSTRLMSTKPESVTDSQGGLVWQLGDMQPGAKTSVEMKLMPTAEGNEIGSVAMVRFGTPASVRTVATKPMLNVEVVTEDRVMVESDTTMTIRISNPGSGIATGVTLEERIPQGLQHPAGAELEYEVGDLAPKASKTIQLKLSAIRPGLTKNLLIARADGLKDVVRESKIEVVAPALKLAMKGPKSRYLNRKASYEVSVSNPGSAAARDVRLVATLPPGLKFVEANNNGHYDPNSRTVQWALAELPVNETGTVRLTALPVEMGNHAVQVQGSADRTVAVKEKQSIKVDGIAALRFEVVDVKDPVEVGTETAYEIRVLNQGTKDASNVALQVTLPNGFELIDAEAPGSLRHKVESGRISFEPIRRLAPRVDTTFRVRVRGRQAGDHRLRVELNADDLRAPVVKEESTRVFGDPQ